jgi:anti-sigma factor RsiW
VNYDDDVELSVHHTASRGADSTSVGLAEMDHRAVRERLSDYAEGSLSPAETEQVREHLAACAACRVFQSTLQETVRLTGGLPRPQLPGGTKRRIAERIKGIIPTT